MDTGLEIGEEPRGEDALDATAAGGLGMLQPIGCCSFYHHKYDPIARMIDGFVLCSRNVNVS